MERLDAWAAALKLTEQEREHFLDLACIAHLPEEIRPRFEKILARIEAIEKQRK